MTSCHVPLTQHQQRPPHGQFCPIYMTFHLSQVFVSQFQNLHHFICKHFGLYP